MATQLSKFRNALLTTVALLGVGLPLGSLLPSNAALAQSTSQSTAQSTSKKTASHHHHKSPIQTPPAQTPPTQTSPPKTAPMNQTPTFMESYSFNYQYVNKPIINGGPTPESYLGTGFAPAGTYKPGQTITIVDNFGRSVGTYTIGSVNDQTPYDAQQLNKVTVVEYDYDLAMAPVVTRVTTGTGLGASGGSNGLGSEKGTLIGRGAEGTDVTFTNQHTAINPIHF
jgi:hypothetical protein